MRVRPPLTLLEVLGYATSSVSFYVSLQFIFVHIVDPER
jgi:hypothetical protein